MKTFKGYGNFWKIYGMTNRQLWLLEVGLRFIVITRPLRRRFTPRNAHWINEPRQPRYERHLFWFLVAVIITMSRPETILFNVMVGAALSFGFILYVLFRLIFRNAN